MQTIGVAVAIPEPWATELQDYRAALGDAAAGTIPTHITLLPPTEVEPPVLEELTHHLERAAGSVAGFEVHLRGTGTFRPVSPVVFIALAAGISQCEELAHAVRQGPVGTEPTFPYHPHVTVAHHLGDDVLDRAYVELASYECRFAVDRFHLYVHDEGRGWQPWREFALRGAQRQGDTGGTGGTGDTGDTGDTGATGGTGTTEHGAG